MAGLTLVYSLGYLFLGSESNHHHMIAQKRDTTTPFAFAGHMDLLWMEWPGQG